MSKTGERGFDVFVVADYGKNDPAFKEVNAKLRSQGGTLIRSVEDIVVPPFNTLATGFWIRQIGIENGYPDLVVFSNTAPRGKAGGGDEGIKWEGDETQRLLYGRLKNDVPVFAISSGYTWSFVKDELKAFHDLAIDNKGSQFRSRDIYPGALVRILEGDSTVLGKEIDPSTVPYPPIDQVAFEDGYGNLKLTTKVSQLSPHLRRVKHLEAVVGGVRRIITNQLSGESGPEGGLFLEAGSSGDIKDRFLEINRLGGSAAEAFGNPVATDQGPKIELSSYRIAGK